MFAWFSWTDELRLVDEHADELFVLRDVRQDALDRDEPLEALDAERLRAKHLGHAADVDSLEQEVLAEGSRLLHGGLGSDAGVRGYEVGPYPKSIPWATSSFTLPAADQST